MRDKHQKRSPVRSSLRSLGESMRQAGPAATASYSLTAAILLFGGLGYVADGWLETEPWFLLAGLILGIVVGFYQLARAVWRH